ncbi:TrkA-N domain dehydrogenase [Penicillium longicatenatum]|uniref:TrkA-N domain dehydrogenase n=1 Tax=Penicillium longicatenatum TaxID=1561947 RepID=UPI00254675C9|nr:TrkA-N domain dehydrogenase [Penicillium longicatenatum]KAJ5636662.1 TrkA-N domain dehydrogenase [Penicillium longicatenatum]
MRVLVIGASGRTGKLVLDELQYRGHQITVLVRNPAALEGYQVDVVKGTPTNMSDMRAAFNKNTPEVVIVTLSAPRASDSPFAAPISPPRLMADCNANVVAAMKEFGVPKVVILQAFGVGASWSNMPFMLRLLMGKSNMRHQYEDHNHTDREVRASGVSFVLVRPSRLVDSDVLEVHEWPEDGKGVSLMASAGRKSVAHFLVDAATESKWDNTAPVITN